MLNDGWHELMSECSTINWRPDRSPEERVCTVLDRLAVYADERGHPVAAAAIRNFVVDNYEKQEEEEDDETDETDE